MKVKYLLTVAMAGLLVGCSTVSQVSKQGTTDEPVFPELKKLTMKNGTWPNLENLRNVQSGATRDQLYDLIGHPHFAEGFGTKEWDYLFHFNTKESTQSCQFKVLFDKDKIARSFYWAPESCANIINPPVAFLLDADVTFAFDSAELTAQGYNAVSNIAQDLQQQVLLESVVVAGHTDRLGSATYNENLSMARAETVRQALVNEGVNEQVIEVVGHGESQPLVQCEYGNKAELISCLAPNRRVEIIAEGMKANHR